MRLILINHLEFRCGSLLVNMDAGVSERISRGREDGGKMKAPLTEDGAGGARGDVVDMRVEQVANLH